LLGTCEKENLLFQYGGAEFKAVCGISVAAICVMHCNFDRGCFGNMYKEH
jgi:hypothetical protein